MEYNVGGFPSSPGSQDSVTNATAEIAAAANFPHIRVMTVGQLYDSSVAVRSPQPRKSWYWGVFRCLTMKSLLIC